MTKPQKILTILAAVTLIILFGCSMSTDLATPCYVDKDAAVFANKPLTSILPWTTVWDAKRIESAMSYQYAKNNLEFNQLRGSLLTHLAEAEQLQQALFSADGILGPALFSGLGISFGALAIPRKRERELEKKLNGTNS